MATDQLTVTLAVLNTVGPIVAGAVTFWLSQRFQAKRDTERHARDLEREKVRQRHELRRDQRAKHYEFSLQEYKERREACMALLAATRHSSIIATSRYEALQSIRGPRTSEMLASATAEAEAFRTHSDLARQKVDQALEVLSADEDAVQVMRLYRSLPYGRLLDAPRDNEVRQAWKNGVGELQQAIFVYLRTAREKILPVDADDER